MFLRVLFSLISVAVLSTSTLASNHNNNNDNSGYKPSHKSQSYKTKKKYNNGKSQVPINLNDLEKSILVKINQERTKLGLKPIRQNNNLIRTARKQSEVMAKDQKLSHTIKGKDLSWRISKSGYKAQGYAENIAITNADKKYGKADAVVQGWMTSQGHRLNMLNKLYTQAGVGMATAANGDIYYTVVFANPM